MMAPTEPDFAQTSDEQRAIPFDYTFRFDLKGEIDRVHRGFVTISVEASFTAVSIGYGVVPRVTPIIFGPVIITVNPATLPAGDLDQEYEQTITQTGGEPPVVFSVSEGQLPPGLELLPGGLLEGTPTATGVFLFTIRATDDQGFFGERAYALEITSDSPIPIARARGDVPLPNLRAITINNLLNGLQRALAQTPDLIRGETGPEAAFKAGVKLNPQFAELALLNDGRNAVSDEETLQSLFQVVSAPSDEIQFLYALFDEGSGREFQSEPLLNTAGLGASDGARPFRYFARPITFEPRSTIRLEITEKSDFPGELHVSLHGYKVLGAPGAPTGRNGGGFLRRR
ncbi:MAG TPA: putative Ig domain-containing protein [Blastocatellia bacterium]